MKLRNMVFCKLLRTSLYNFSTTNSVSLMFVYTYLSSFVWKVLKHKKMQCILAVCCGREDILRSANEFMRNICRWGRQKMLLRTLCRYYSKGCVLMNTCWNTLVIESNLDVELPRNYRFPFQVFPPQKAEVLHKYLA